MTKAQILVVEDENIVALDLRNRLTGLGYVVPAVAASGEDAIAKATQHHPDLVLMDIKLKGQMDGIEAAEQIRSQLHIPVVYLTAYADEATLQRAKITQPFGYVLKPFEERELSATIEMALYRHEMERRLQESERWLSTTLRSIGDAVITTDDRGHISFINPIAEALTGWTQAEALGQPLTDVFSIISEETRTVTEDPVAEALQKGTVVGLRNHTLLIAKDGTETPIDDSAAPIRDDQGHITGVVLVFRDVTARRRAQQTLRESEELYRTLIETSPDAITVTDLNGQFTLVNQRAAELHGCESAEELLGRDGFGLIAPEDRQLAIENALKTLETESVRNAHYTMIKKDGSSFSAELNTSRVVDADGNPTAFIGVTRDTTARQQAEAERERLLAQIQEQAQRVQQIVRTVPEGVLLLDADGQIILTNPKGGEYLALLAGAAVGDTLTYLGDRPLIELLTSPPSGLWHEATTDGRGFEIIARPLETGSEPQGWVLVIRDVTQERAIQQHTRQQERLAAVGQLAAGIAHDFNNILATIVLHAQMAAQAEELSPRDRERMTTITQQAMHATELIQQILDFSRHAVIKRQPLDLLSLLKEQIKLLKRTLPENIEVTLTHGPTEYTVNADPTRILQAVMNLALNARDAMPEGGELRFGLERMLIENRRGTPVPEMETGEWIQMTVSDTGMGIPADVLPHIFDPFFTTKSPGEGTGLGLAQVHGIIKQHEGEISVESQVDGGTKQPGSTTFTIYLPAMPARPRTVADVESIPLIQGQGETILVVEDNAATRGALVDTLEVLNYQVLEAADGQEALTVVAQRGEEIALVLSDVVMPSMGGIALFHALRERNLGVGVVMLTGHPLQKELEDLRSQGLIDWMLKPPSLEHLAEAVAQGLKQA